MSERTAGRIVFLLCVAMVVLVGVALADNVGLDPVYADDTVECVTTDGVYGGRLVVVREGDKVVAVTPKMTVLANLSPGQRVLVVHYRGRLTGAEFGWQILRVE